MSKKYIAMSVLTLAVIANAAQPLSYSQVPSYDVWIEGETPVATNFYPGESRYNWWHEYAPLSGRGLLELNMPDLQEEQEYYADYSFTVPQAGSYQLFGRTRVPMHLASPYYVRIDDLPERRQPHIGGDMNTNLLAQTINYKMGVFDLGIWDLAAGEHSLKVVVRDLCRDNVGPEAYFNQGIDSFFLRRVQTRPMSDPLENQQPIPVFEVAVDPNEGQYPLVGFPSLTSNWELYGILTLTLKVESDAKEAFSARIRCFYDGSKFIDLPVLVEPKDFGKVVELSYDLPEEFQDKSRANVTSCHLYTFSKWFTQNGNYTVRDINYVLHKLAANAPAIAVPDDRTMQAPGNNNSAGPDEFVWNQAFLGGESKELPAFPLSAQTLSAQGDTGTLEMDVTNGVIRRMTLNREPLLELQEGIGGLRLHFLNGTILNATENWQWRTAETGELIGEFDTAKVKITATAKHITGNEFSVRYVIANQSEQSISEVSFDVFRGVKCQPFGADGGFLVGSRHYKQTDLQSLQSLYAPQMLTHNFVTAYGAGKALYAYVAEKNPLDARADFGRENDELHCRFSIFPQIKPGESYESEVVIGVANGNWMAGADSWRKWWQSWAHSPYIPDWFQRAGGFFVEWDPAGIEAIKEKVGIYLSHSGAWLKCGTEGWYPESYHLPEEWAQEWQSKIADAHSKGNRVSIYSNPLMISRVIKDFKDHLSKYLVYEKDGFPVYSEHTHRHHPMGLPAVNENYADIYLENIGAAIDQLQPDCLYMDQLGAVPFHVDYQPETKGNRHFGEWSYGQARFSRKVIETLRQKHPEMVFGIECINVQAQQFVTFALLVHEPNVWKYYRYMFPDQYCYIGNYDYVTVPEAIEFAHVALLSGNPLLLYQLPKDATEEDLQQLKALVEFKQKHDPELYECDFQGLVVDAPELRVSKFLHRDNGESLYVYVAQEETSRVLDGKTISFPKGFGIAR